MSQTEKTPLAVLRAQGLDADFSRCRVRVFPKPKITKDIRTYVTENLPAIIDELALEAHHGKNPDPLGYQASIERDAKVAGGCLLWPVDDATRTKLGGQAADHRDVIPDHANGGLAA